MSTEQLVEVNKAIDVCLAKLGRRPRTLRNFHRLLRQGERKLLPLINEWMDESIKEMRAGLPKMKGRTAAQRVKSIADWDRIREQGVIILKPPLLELLSEGGKAVVERGMLKQERFDPIGESAVSWTTAHSANLVAEITQETMLGIKDVIATGLDAGKSIPTIARELRPIVGLNSQYAGAVANFQTKLLEEGVAASKAAAKAETYANRLHRRRATTIARTETAFALTEGQRQGYGQMGIGKLERVEDPDCCDICAEFNGRIYTIAEAEGVLPEHPNCEGTWIAAAGEKPKPYEIEATGPRRERIKSVESALKELPRRHAMRVEKFHIETTARISADVPAFKGKDIAGYWRYGDKSVHFNAKWMDKGTVFHEVGHAAYETGIVEFTQKPVWEAWYKKAAQQQIKFPSRYSLTNVDEFFAECYSNYYMKRYDLIDTGIKKWFDKSFKGGL